jgi:hypothetical protein
MTEPPLNRPDIVPLVGKRIAASMAKHVRVKLQFEANVGTRHHGLDNTP